MDMGTDDDTGRVPYVYNASAIYQPPNFAGSTKAKRFVFVRAYHKYVGQINALQCVGSRPFAMPVSACMDPFSKRRIALFDFNRDHDTITEAGWVSWFMAAFDEDTQDLEVLKQRLKRAIRFDIKIVDAQPWLKAVQAILATKVEKRRRKTLNPPREIGLRNCCSRMMMCSAEF